MADTQKPCTRCGACANRAATVLDRAVSVYGAENEDRETVLQDLLSDLMHLCDQDGLDFDALAERAAGHHREEVDGADCGDDCPRHGGQ